MLETSVSSASFDLIEKDLESEGRSPGLRAGREETKSLARTARAMIYQVFNYTTASSAANRVGKATAAILVRYALGKRFARFTGNRARCRRGQHNGRNPQSNNAFS